MKTRIVPVPRAVVLAVLCLAATPRAARSAGADQTVWADMAVSRNEVFQHETFILTLRISSLDVRLDQTFELTGLPSSEKLVHTEFERTPVTREAWGKGIREVRTFRCEAAAPSPGGIVIAPTLRVAVLTRSQGLIGYTWVRTQREIEVAPVRLEVKPLPREGRPDDFSGAVGSFTMDVEVGPLEVAPGDLVTLRTLVRGKGHTEGMKPPSAAVGPDFKVYQPTLVQGAADDLISFEQVLIPRGTQAVEIASVSLCYFDPEEGKYRTLQRGPFRLAFRKSAPPAAPEPFKPGEGKEYAGRTSGPIPRPVGASGAGGAQPGRLTGRVLAAWIGTGTFALAALRAAFVALSGIRRRRALAALTVFIAAATASLLCLQWALRGGAGKGLAAVRITRKTDVRLAPGRTALQTFDIPAGASVYVLEGYGNWVKIRSGSRRGWIPRDALDAPTAPTPSANEHR